MEAKQCEHVCECGKSIREKNRDEVQVFLKILKTCGREILLTCGSGKNSRRGQIPIMCLINVMAENNKRGLWCAGTI